MEFRCNAAPNAVPCVRISRTDDQGRPLMKPKKTFKVVKNGESVFSWIDRCSRKHFTAADAEARALNERDYNEMFAELGAILEPHGKQVPKGTTFAVLADSLAKIEYDKNKKQEAKRPELLTIPSEPIVEEAPELTNKELKAKLDELGVEYPSVVNKTQLKELLAEAVK